MRRGRRYGLRSFRVVAGQIRTSQRLTYGITASLKGKQLCKAELPGELEDAVCTCLDWTLPLTYEMAVRIVLVV